MTFFSLSQDFFVILYICCDIVVGQCHQYYQPQCYLSAIHILFYGDVCAANFRTWILCCRMMVLRDLDHQFQSTIGNQQHKLIDGWFRSRAGQKA